MSLYLGFKLRNPNFPESKITLKQILSHTSSLNDGPYYDDFLTASYNINPPPKTSDLLAFGGKYYSEKNYHLHEPGTYYVYCNMNFGIVGTIIEKISGQRFDIFVKKRIFEKMLLKSTFNVAEVPNINDLAIIYTYNSTNN